MPQYYPEIVSVNQLRYGDIIFYNNQIYTFQHINYYWNGLELGVKIYPDPDDIHITTKIANIKLDTEFVTKLMTDYDYINISMTNINNEITLLTAKNNILKQHCDDYNNIIQMNINNGFTNNEKITQKIIDCEKDIANNIVKINNLNDELLMILV